MEKITMLLHGRILVAATKIVQSSAPHLGGAHSKNNSVLRRNSGHKALILISWSFLTNTQSSHITPFLNSVPTLINKQFVCILKTYFL